MARTKRTAFRTEPIELRVRKDIPNKPHYGQIDPDPLDAPSSPCSSQKLNDRVLVALEQDARGILEGITSEGLTEVCCGDHSHGLLHEAARLRAWKCMSWLLHKGWEPNRRLKFWTTAGEREQNSRPGGVIDSMLPLWEFIGADDDTVLEFPHGERYVLRRSKMVLEYAMPLGESESLAALFEHGADPDGDLLEKLIKAMTNEEKKLQMQDDSFLHYALYRDRFDLARILVPHDEDDPPPDLPFRVLSADAVVFASGTDSICEGLLTYHTVAQMIEEHRHDNIQYLLAYLGVVDTRMGMLWWQKAEPIYLSLLTFAIDQSCHFSMNLILELCPTLNLDGYSDHETLPLHQAAQSPHDHADDIRFLLDRGANPDKRLASVHEPEPKWFSTGLRSLLSAGAATRQFTFPVCRGDTACASPNIQNFRGNTPLHCHAARAGFKDEDFKGMRRLLVHAGADVRVRNKAGFTADELRLCIARMVKRKPSKKTGPAMYIESPPPASLALRMEARLYFTRMLILTFVVLIWRIFTLFPRGIWKRVILRDRRWGPIEHILGG